MTRNKLNLLATPSRTPLLYTLLSAGVALILILAFFGRTLDLGLPQLVTIFFVSLYYYLSYPDRVINRYDLTPFPSQYQEAKDHIFALAKGEVPHKLHLFLSRQQSFTFGIFKHNYLVIPEAKVRELCHILQQNQATDEIDAKLLPSA